MNLKKIKENEKGATAVIVALLMAFLFGVIALVVDLGRGYTLKAQMQSACDLASLAGAEVLAKNAGNTSGADATAKLFAMKNGFEENVQVEILEGTKVKVSISNTQKNYFAGVIGINETNVACTATASIGSETVAQKDFDYAIFSGSDSHTLNFTGSNSIVDGKIHSNSSISGGSITYKQASAVNGGSFGWAAYSIAGYDENGNIIKGTWENGTAWGSVDIPKGDHVDMPYYLGDAISKTIDDLAGTRIPPSSYDAVYTLTQTQSNGGNELKNMGALNQTGKIKIIPKGDIETTYAFNPSANTIFIDNANSVDVNFQFAQVSTINADIFIDAHGKNIRLYSAQQYTAPNQWWSGGGSPTVINGNIYVSNGNLQLGNMRVNGNVYVDGILTTNGGTMEIFAPLYIYAHEIGGQNTMNMTGVVVTEGDMEYQGGRQSFTGNDNILSVYSKYGNIKFTNDGDYRGYLFAPYGDISTAGGTSNMYGRIIADTISFGNQVEVYPSDVPLLPEEMLKNLGGGTSPTKKVVKLIE